MPPLEKRLDDDDLLVQSSVVRGKYPEEAEKPKLLFGCLDIFPCWSPCPLHHHETNIDDDVRSSTSLAPTELYDDAPRGIKASDSLLDEVDNSSGSIVLQTIVSYPSGEFINEGALANLDTYLSIQNSKDSRRNDLLINGQSSELSFSYSSFSENEERDDNGSTGDDSTLSFDPKDFLEDDQDELAKEERLPKKLGTIMECNENYSSRSFR